MAKAKKRKAVVRKAKAGSFVVSKEAIDQQLALEAVMRAKPAPQLSSNVPLLAQMLKDAEMRAEAATQKYNELSRKLVGLLTADQLDAARVCGVTPEFYAIEFIELAKNRLFPKFESAIRNFSQLRTEG